MTLTLKRAAAILMACLMLVSLAACKAGGDTSASPEPSAEATGATADLDRDAVAAKVGDYEITVGDLEDSYNSYVEMMTAYGYSVTTDADIESIQDTVLQGLVEQQVLLHQAAEQGCDTLSDEQEAELRETVDGQIESLISQFSADAETEGTDEDIRNAAIEKINEELIAYGMDVDFDGYCQQIEDYYRSEYIVNNLQEAVKSTVTVTADEVKEYYDTLYAEQSASITDDPKSYLASEEAFEMNGGEPVLFVPEGYVRIKALTVQPEGTIDASYETLKTELADLEAEFGKLSLSGEENSKRLSEIRTTYAAKKLEADKLFETFTAAARAKIEEAKAALDAGTRFDEVFAAYNEDESYTTYELFNARGRLMMQNEDDGAWDEALRLAAKGLKDGEYSDIVEIEGSYYIVYLVGPESAGDVSYDSVYADVEALALEQAQATLWESKIDEWAADASLVTLYEETFRAIGKK